MLRTTVRLDTETKFPYFLFLTWLSIIRNPETAVTAHCESRLFSYCCLPECDGSLCSGLGHELRLQRGIVLPMLVHCWASVIDVGAILNRFCRARSHLLGGE